jgi:hypothetical protein
MNDYVETQQMEERTLQILQYELNCIEQQIKFSVNISKPIDKLQIEKSEKQRQIRDKRISYMTEEEKDTIYKYLIDEDNKKVKKRLYSIISNSP